MRQSRRAGGAGERKGWVSQHPTRQFMAIASVLSRLQKDAPVASAAGGIVLGRGTVGETLGFAVLKKGPFFEGMEHV